MRWLSYLGARYGIALFLALLIAGLVVTVRLISPEGSSPSSSLSTNGDSISATNAPEDEDLQPSRPPIQPSISPGATPPPVVAKTFIQAWLHHTNITADAWRAQITPYATSALLAKLKGTDPADVPADQLTGEPSPGSFSGQSFVEYTLPVNSGNVILRLVSERSQWKVDTIDWEPTR